MANVAEARSALHDVVRSGVATAVQRDAEALLAPGSEGLMKLLDAAVVEGIEVALAEVSEDYATRTLGAERYSRSAARVGSRSGHRTRSVVTPFGKLELRFVKTRTATLVPAWAENIGRFAAEVVHLGREVSHQRRRGDRAARCLGISAVGGEACSDGRLGMRRTRGPAWPQCAWRAATALGGRAPRALTPGR